MKILVNSDLLHEPLVSLVINTSGINITKIERLLQSIARQTYRDFEVIVATESNGDKILWKASMILCNVFPLKVIETELWNRCRTANMGIGLSRGRYVALLEDDLVLNPSWLKTLVDRVARSPSEVACCYGRCLTPGGSESLMLQHKRLFWPIKIIRTLMMHNSLLRKVREPITFNLAVLCKKRALIEAGLFDAHVEEPILGEDYDLAMRIVRKGYAIVCEQSAFSLHYTKHVGKRVCMVKRNPHVLARLVQNEIYFLTKNRDILGFYLVPHVIYRAIFEGINMALRSGTLQPVYYALVGTVKGLIAGFRYRHSNFSI